MKKGILIMSVLTPLLCFLLLFTGGNAPQTPPAPVSPIPGPVDPVKPIAPRPGSKVEWMDFQPLKNLSDPSWGNYLTDIENHLHPSMGKQYRDTDKVTWAHETTHGIHSWLNNSNLKPGDRSYYFMYVGHNKAAKIKQPNIQIADVAKMVPDSLKKSRFNLYLVQQRRDWNNDPIYLWDEWVAYCNGSECGIELVTKKIYAPNKNDSCWGVLEFNVYATYVAMAQKKHDPTYNDKQLLEFLAWNLERGMRLYKDGQKLDVYNWDNGKYLIHLQTHADAAEFRNFIITTYGAEWAEEVFGFRK
jgi:hypothetical protein